MNARITAFAIFAMLTGCDQSEANWTSPDARVDEMSECRSQQLRQYRRLAELPTDAVKALGFKMAERGQPFQSTDVRGWPAGLPSARFESATLRRCTLTIRYELGGLYKRWGAVTLVKSGSAWTRALSQNGDRYIGDGM